MLTAPSEILKVCFKCSAPKPLDEFYDHPQMADGKLGKCKECAKKDSNDRRWAKIDDIRAWKRGYAKRPHVMAKNRRYQKLKPEVHKAANQRYGERYPEKKKATVAVSNAVRDGRLFKQPCSICGAVEVEAHHEDYSKRLEVIWVCNPHHKELDKKRREREAMAAKFKKPELLTERDINTIRGKAIVGHATPQELMQIFGHYDLIEAQMDEMDGDDYFGTEGWRHHFGLPDAAKL